MMHIAITAGGTEEPIDGVRKITNTSSGSLGWYCLEATLRFMRNKNETNFIVHYIKAPKAIIKELSEEDKKHVDFINVSNTKTVYESVSTLMNQVDVAIFIHAMAISDFSYSYSTTISTLAKELHHAFTKNREVSLEDIQAMLKNPSDKHDADDKISSSEGIIMGLETTPKVISMIKQKQLDTFLVGFKLVKHNKDNNLIKQAEKLRLANNCDAVFANEASQLSDKGHAGVLIHKGKVVAQPIGKKQIAEAIINLALNKIKGK